MSISVQQQIELSSLKDPVENFDVEEVLPTLEKPIVSNKIFSRGVVLYLLAIAVNTLMHATSKLALEDVETVVAVQIRMIFTAIISISAMYFQRVEYNVFGAPQHRPLLLLRGALGFFNITATYFSLNYLTLPDVAALGFLTPLCTVIVASAFLGERLTWQQILCSVISLCGVVIIARPPALFGDGALELNAQRTFAVTMCLISVFGTGIVTILVRKLKDAHALQSGGAYACVSTIGSTVFILVRSLHTGHADYPKDLKSVSILAVIGVLGFILQWLQALALQLEEASYLVNFRYTSLIGAALWEFVFFGDWPDMYTVVGTTIVLVSVVYGASCKR